ncbi:MAG: thiolase family protein [Promethearchaeota archaeon]
MSTVERVAIVGYHQLKPALNDNRGRYEAIFKTVRGALDSAGLKRKDVTTVVSATNDFYDGRTISNCWTVEAGGAYMKDETKVEMDGAYAILYGLMRVMSGHHKLAVVWGASQASCFPYDSTRLQMTDPTFERQVGFVNHYTAAGFGMRAYLERHGLSAEEVAKIVVKNRANAAKNEFALPESKVPVTVEEVLSAPVLASPVTEPMYSVPCDGAACVLLAPERQALKITDDPVWITGVGFSQETYYLGDRDLATSSSAKKAAQAAYQMADVKDPVKDVQVAEIYEAFAHEEAILAEALGLAKEGAGCTPDVPVNQSGGAQSGNALCATGIVRVIEAARQVRGEAGDHQVSGVQRAVALGQEGFAAQNAIVYVLEGGKK